MMRFIFLNLLYEKSLLLLIDITIPGTSLRRPNGTDTRRPGCNTFKSDTSSGR